MRLRLGFLFCLFTGCAGFAPKFLPRFTLTPAQSPTCPTHTAEDINTGPALSRRQSLEVAVGVLCLSAFPYAVHASGGATAGKYTTIPIAKRRYFGRVKQGVFEFLQMEAVVNKGDLKSDLITNFFSPNIQQTSERAKRNCVGSSTACMVEEKYTSRWEDLQLSMFLLGNAFRMDSGKPPEKVKQVKEAKAFFAQMEKLRAAAKTNNDGEAVLRFAAAKDALEIFLNDVELPPTAYTDYSSPTSTNVPSLCQGSFCI